MSQKIQKHIKATFTCSNCNKKQVKRIITTELDTLSIAAINPQVLEYKPSSCMKCKSAVLNTSYSFYHEEKIN